MQNGRTMLQSCHKHTHTHTHTHTHIHLLMGGLQSSSPLNLRWGLTLVWTLRGCWSSWARCVSPIAPPSSSVTASLHPLLFHIAVGDNTTLKHTHTHIYLLKTRAKCGLTRRDLCLLFTHSQICTPTPLAWPGAMLEMRVFQWWRWCSFM